MLDGFKVPLNRNSSDQEAEYSSVFDFFNEKR